MGEAPEHRMPFLREQADRLAQSAIVFAVHQASDRLRDFSGRDFSTRSQSLHFNSTAGKLIHSDFLARIVPEDLCATRPVLKR
jgi:hypothetical protein